MKSYIYYLVGLTLFFLLAGFYLIKVTPTAFLVASTNSLETPYFDYQLKANGTFAIVLGNYSGASISAGQALVELDLDEDNVFDVSMTNNEAWSAGKTYVFKVKSRLIAERFQASQPYRIKVKVRFTPQKMITRANEFTLNGVVLE